MTQGQHRGHDHELDVPWQIGAILEHGAARRADIRTSVKARPVQSCGTTTIATQLRL